MELLTPDRLRETVADCQERVKAATERITRTFEFVPDGKLAWSPSASSRSAIAIVAHCSLANRMFAKVIRGEEISPMPTREETSAFSRKFEATVTDRADAVGRLSASSKEVIAALGTMTPERFVGSANSPVGMLPVQLWMYLPGRHMENHAAQIDYIQTIWGDLTSHV